MSSPGVVVAVAVFVGVAVAVAVFVGVAVGVAVGSSVAVAVAVFSGVFVGVAVLVGVAVGVAVVVLVGVAVGVAVTVGVGVGTATRYNTLPRPAPGGRSPTFQRITPFTCFPELSGWMDPSMNTTPLGTEFVMKTLFRIILPIGQ